MRLDPATINELCRAARHLPNEPDAVADFVIDDSDASIWVRLSGDAPAKDVPAALTDHGLAATEHPNHRIHVTGWDARLLRRRLGMLLAGVDDLTDEWDATSELARYHYDRRIRANGGQPPEAWEVLADVENVLRRAVPIPHHAPAVHDIDQLHALVEAAEDAYQQLIIRHVDHAEAALAADRDRQCGAAGRSEPARAGRCRRVVSRCPPTRGQPRTGDARSSQTVVTGVASAADGPRCRMVVVCWKGARRREVRLG